MSTRGLVRIFDENDKQLVCCYNHSGSYPDGLGLDLANFLSGFKVVSGISLGERPEKLANTMRCLAAQLIAYFKKGVGGFYIYSIDTIDAGQDYEYHIKINNDKIILSCPDIEFEGYPEDFKNYLNLYNKNGI